MFTQSEILFKLSQVKCQLNDEFGIRDIALFGYYAWDEQSAQRDIDLFIEQPEPDYRKLAGALIFLESLFGSRVDLVRKHNKMRPSFIDRIEREAIYV